MDHHPASREMPTFKYRIRKTFKDCLTRQTTEAVAILLHQGDLLNGKNDYLTNCITRVKVEEEAYERKKREHQEEEEEKARLIRLEEFKGQKCRGMKRRSGTSITQEKEERRCSKRRKLKEPEQTQTEAINNILAIEHQSLYIQPSITSPSPKL